MDEAYLGFSKNNYQKFINNYKNLIIIRTLSKAYGMAGLRIGYLLSNKNRIDELKFRPLHEIANVSSEIANIMISEIKENFYRSNQNLMNYANELSKKYRFKIKKLQQIFFY